MAVAELIVSRREVLAAGCAACLTRHPELDSGSTFPPSPLTRSWTPDQVRGDVGGRNADQSRTVTKWDRALARCRRAEAALAAAGHEPDEELYGDLVVAFNRALERLLRTPAPDLPALALKIDLTIDQSAWELTGGESCLASLERDTRRLCRQG